MKTYKHLWEDFISEENFRLAYKNSIKRKRKQRQIASFQKDIEKNLEEIRQRVISGEFHTSKYREMTIYEPKERIIYKLPYNPDRIVQHAVMNILKPILTNLLIENTYACIEGRGTHKASQKCAEFTRKYDYCLKCDIRKFYPSIDQKILSDMLHRIIKDKRFMALVDDIVFSFPGGKNAPIGNYCSQWFGNFYLSKLDNFILHDLKCKGYLRYCDDFILYSNSKTFLQSCKSMIRYFLSEELKLDFSKSEVFQTKQGVDFCGYRHFKKYLLLRKSTAKRMKRRFMKIKIDGEEKEKILGQIASANGQLKHCCGHNLRESINLTSLERRLRNAETIIQREAQTGYDTIKYTKAS